MAEEQRQLLPAPLSIPWSRIAQRREVAFALRWYGLPLAALFGLVGSLLYVREPDVMRPIFDDSYISLYFARNIAEHGKLSFDGEEWTTGATSPLHVLIMALWLKLGASPFFTSVAVGVASHALLAAGVYLLAFSIFRSRLAGILAGFAIAFTSFAALDSGNGLETSLFMALVAFAAASYFLGSGPWARLGTGVIIGLAVLTRPEGAFLIPAVVIYRWIDRPAGERLRPFLRDAALLALPGLAAGGMLALYSLIVSGSLGGTGGAKVAFFQEDEAIRQYKLTVAADQVGLFMSPLIPLLALAAVGLGRRQALLFALFWAPVLIAYALFFPGGLAHYFYRYQHPTLPFIAAFAGGGAALLISVAMTRDVVFKALVVAALVIVAVPMYDQYTRWRDIYVDAATETRQDLEAMALDLNTIVQPDETLATHDIGAVAYFAEYEVVDLVGLVNEDVIKYHDDRRLRDYVELVQPDYLLVFPEWDIWFLLLDTANQPERYELIKTYEGGEVRRTPYLLFRVHYN